MLAVARIALVKPDKAQAVENLVIQLAQRGQLSERVGPLAVIDCELHHVAKAGSTSQRSSQRPYDLLISHLYAGI